MERRVKMEHSVALQQVWNMCACVRVESVIYFLAIFPMLVYLGWSMKNLYNTIRVNQKGGEYK